MGQMIVKKKIFSGTDVSVIIRTKNEERWIGHAIQSVLDNIHKPEIIIIDNNSKDSTLDIVNNFLQDPLLNNNSNQASNYTDIKIIKIDKYSPGKSLNLGVKNAKNKYILILSAHCELKSIDLPKIKSYVEKKYLAVFGNQIPKWNGKKIVKRYLWSHFEENTKVENMFSKLERRYFFHNALSFFKKRDLLKYKFNEILAGKEDRYWANNIVKLRKKYLYDSSFCAVHHYTDNGNTWKGLG
jgi:rhamnosyltransferase